MPEENLPKSKKTFSPDWLVQGILSKIGDIFDKLTGRGWQTSSSLTTSELSERLKSILDSEVKDLGPQGRFVPHNIKLKMQWNKFSTDAEGGLKRLEYEMLATAIDHINDCLYHTYKPLKIEVKPDYFTEGVKFFASFGEFDTEEREVEVNITIPQMNMQNLIPAEVKFEPAGEIVVATFSLEGKEKTCELKFTEGKRVGVGRTKENDLSIEDVSISKIHAALVLNSAGQLMVADTGSTNGTFINGQRVAYGRAFVISESDKVKFGTVEVFFRRAPQKADFATQEQYALEQPATEAFKALPVSTLQASQQPTQANQMEVQNAENLPSLSIQATIPNLPEYNFAEDPHQKTEVSEAPPWATEANPAIPAQNLANQTMAKVETNEEEVNLTEPGIKLNFRDEEKN